MVDKLKLNCKTDKDWLEITLHSVETAGYQVVEGVLDDTFLDLASNALYRTKKLIINDIGRERLDNAGELGVLRFMMKYDSFFFRFLEIPEMLMVVDEIISSTAVLHTQNGFILPSLKNDILPEMFQTSFHPDFPRYLEGYVASVNTLFVLSEFAEQSGATYVVPGTHQLREHPDKEYLEKNKIPIECPAGSMIVFDSTLLHASGHNHSGIDRLSVNQQFTKSFFKQQLDYCRGLDDGIIPKLPVRSQQLLGWYTRVPTSLDEYYCLPDERLYRAGQG